MSRRLSMIPETCPMYKDIEVLFEDFERELKKSDTANEALTLFDWYHERIIEKAEEIRSTAGDLRETASDIASEKNREIDELNGEIEGYKEHESELNDEIEALKYDIQEIRENEN